MVFMLKRLDFLLKLMDFLLKVMDFVLKMVDFSGGNGEFGGNFEGSGVGGCDVIHLPPVCVRVSTHTIATAAGSIKLRHVLTRLPYQAPACIYNVQDITHAITSGLFSGGL